MIQDNIQILLNLYHSSKNAYSFFSRLKTKKYKKQLQLFLQYNKETCLSSKIKCAWSQTLYNLLNNITYIPKYENGIAKIFKNLTVGYIQDMNQLKNGEHYNIQEITDINYMKTVILNLKSIHNSYYKNPLFQLALKQIFKNNYQKIPKKYILSYLIAKTYQPLYCKICGKFIKYPIKNKNTCKDKICKQLYKLDENQYLQQLQKIFNSTSIRRKGFLIHKMVKKSQKLQNIINNKLNFLTKQQLANMSAMQKCYHIFYNIKEIPLCKHCHKNKVQFSKVNYCYKTTCSKKCNNEYIENINKRLTNMNGHTNIGKHEYLIINDLFPNNTFIKKQIAAFHPDFIDEKNKIIYEINQIYHFNKKKIRTDKRKYGYLTHMGWKINVIFDFYQKKLTKHYYDKIINWSNEFKNLTNYILIYKNNNVKILTDTGWSEFAGIIKYQNRQTINVNVKNKNIICTPDHKIFNGKQFVTADTFPYKRNKNEDVYDIINVKNNNRFFINKDILVHNCLVLDEFAFISPGIEQAFMASVFPIISSSKNSQVIVVSTPNGMNNEFYKIWNQALIDNANKDNIKQSTWHPTKIHWSDFPGRDQKWKQLQLATMNNNMVRWNQEFECKFLGSVVTLISSDKIEQFRKDFEDQNNIKQAYEVQIHADLPDLKVNIYMPPMQSHAYIIGADPSTGDGGDYHAMTVWDITNTYNIELVADFYSNKVPPKQFAYLLAKTGFLYNCAYIAIENNGVSFAAIQNLIGDFEYENIVHLGGNPKTNIAIHSSPQLKLDACLTVKELIQDKLRKTHIYNIELINQMQRFQKRSKSGKQPTYGCYGSHDDLMMSMIWALYCLKIDILENYYTIQKYATNKLGNTIPLIVTSDENSNSDYIKQLLYHLDEQFNISQNQQDIQDVTESIESEQQDLMEHFINENNLTSNSFSNNENEPSNNDDSFDFISFTT